VVTAADNYVPIGVNARLRSQAWLAWSIGLAVVLLWLALILAAPVAKANSLESVSSPIYAFFSYLCHQIDSRSLHLQGEKLAVCSRCFGVYAGLLIGFLAYPLWRGIDDLREIPKFWLFLACVPAGVDWSLTIFGIWDNTHLSRLVTGALLGFACGTFIVPAIIEITRNFALRRGTLTRSKA